MLGNTREKKESTNQKHLIIICDVYISSLTNTSVFVANIGMPGGLGHSSQIFFLQQEGITQKHKAQKDEGHMHQCNICEKSFLHKKDPDAHVDNMHDVSTKIPKFLYCK